MININKKYKNMKERILYKNFINKNKAVGGNGGLT